MKKAFSVELFLQTAPKKFECEVPADWSVRSVKKCRESDEFKTYTAIKTIAALEGEQEGGMVSFGEVDAFFKYRFKDPGLSGLSLFKDLKTSEELFERIRVYASPKITKKREAHLKRTLATDTAELVKLCLENKDALVMYAYTLRFVLGGIAELSKYDTEFAVERTIEIAIDERMAPVAESFVKLLATMPFEKVFERMSMFCRKGYPLRIMKRYLSEVRLDEKNEAEIWKRFEPEVMAELSLWIKPEIAGRAVEEGLRSTPKFVSAGEQWGGSLKDLVVENKIKDHSKDILSFALSLFDSEDPKKRMDGLKILSSKEMIEYAILFREGKSFELKEKLAEAIRFAEKTLSAEDPEEQVLAAQMIMVWWGGNGGSVEFAGKRNIFAKLLAHRSEDVRLSAIEVMDKRHYVAAQIPHKTSTTLGIGAPEGWRFGLEEMIEGCLKAAKTDGSLRVRAAAARVAVSRLALMTRHQNLYSNDDIVFLLNHEDKDVRISAMNVLVAMHSNPKEFDAERARTLLGKVK